MVNVVIVVSGKCGKCGICGRCGLCGLFWLCYSFTSVLHTETFVNIKQSLLFPGFITLSFGVCMASFSHPTIDGGTFNFCPFRYINIPKKSAHERQGVFGLV